MPTYTYECSECQHSFDIHQKMTDTPLITCPECKKDKLFKVITGGTGIIMGNNVAMSKQQDRVKRRFYKK